MSSWNSVLQRQLKKKFGSLENLPDILLPFLDVISDTYDHQEKDRKMLERSIELSSLEMKELNQALRNEADANNEALFGKLRESLTLLNEESQEPFVGTDFHKLAHLADLVKKESIKRKIAEEQRNLTEKELIYANRIFRVISQINQAIVRVANEDNLFRDACEIAVECGKFKTACIAVINEDQTATTIRECHGRTTDLSLLMGMTATAWEEAMDGGAYYVCNHIGQDISLDERKWKAADLGYGSCMVLPIRRSGAIIGTFSLYAAETGFFNNTEINLLLEATGDISFALDVLEKDRQRAIADQKMQSSERRLKQAQAIAHLGSWSVDLSTGKSLWSKEALRIYGLDPAEQEQSYETWISCIHPDDLANVLAITKESRATLSRSSFFHRIIRKDGSVRHLYSQTDFEYDAQGKPTGLYGVAHDVTEMKEAEEVIVESRANLQAIFDNTSDGLILTDLDGRVKMFNDQAAGIVQLNIGLSIHPGDTVGQFVYLPQKTKYLKAFKAVLAGKTVKYQQQFTPAPGKVKWLDFTISPVFQSKDINALIVKVSDITERKLAELQLAESEKRYSELFQLSPLPKWVYDQATLRFLDVNQAALDHYGYSREEFLSMTIKAIRPAEDLPVLEKTVKQNKHSEDSVYREVFRHQKKNGERIQVEIQSNPILFKGRKAKIIIARDITEELKYIQAIEAQNKNLLEISWMQSHVIRAPLARIMALLPMVDVEGGSPADQKKILEYLRVSANELDRVIMDITDKIRVTDLK